MSWQSWWNIFEQPWFVKYPRLNQSVWLHKSKNQCTASLQQPRDLKTCAPQSINFLLVTQDMKLEWNEWYHSSETDIYLRIVIIVSLQFNIFVDNGLLDELFLCIVTIQVFLAVTTKLHSVSEIPHIFILDKVLDILCCWV